MQGTPSLTLHDLDEGLRALRPWLQRARDAVAAVEDRANREGGDPGAHGDGVLLARHLGHYLVAASVVDRDAVHRLVDVGSGTGAFTGLLGERLGAAVEVVDHDPTVRAAAAATTGGRAHGSLDEVPPAPLVTAMEVLEHVPPAEQPGFCRALLAAVAPGGTLVLSTPDESLYPGGWSGYGPHVGCVTAGGLRRLLTDAGAADPLLLRLRGGPYDTGAARRLAEAVGNRAWTVLRRRLPALADRLEARPPSGGDALDGVPARARGALLVGPAEEGRGGSLLAVVRSG